MKRFLFLTAGLLATALTVQAQESGLPLWEAGAFAGTASAPSYPGSPDRSTRSLLLPYLVYRGEVLRMERGGIDARLLHTNALEFDVGFSASLPSSSQDSLTRQAMPDLGTLVEFGPRLKLTLARPAPGHRVRLELPLRTVLEVNSGVRQQGVVFEPELRYEARDIGAGWSLRSSVSVILGDQKLNRYFYEVAPVYATATRPAYEARAGLIATRLTFDTTREINPDVRIFGQLRLESYAGAANQNSPLSVQSSGVSVGVGVAWTLGRSETRAP
jgi:outer membrane scaffolding protein for murein synthesis (MipA/OmpV family)